MERTPPSLGTVLADPATFRALSREAQADLYAQVSALEARLRATMLAQPTQVAKAPEPERAVLIEESASLLGMTKDYLYRHWRKLGGYRDDDGHVKFALSTIERHIQRRTGRS